MHDTLTRVDCDNSGIPVVAFVADNHYALPLAAAISSVIVNLDKEQKLRIFIIDVGISLANKSRIGRLVDQEKVNIRWIKPSKQHKRVVRSLPPGYVGRNSYYKMFVHELLGSEYSRIILLDCDVIVEADVTELWGVDIGDNYVLAAQDLLNPLISSPFGLNNWQELGRQADDKLFNSGVMVLNAAKWHEGNVSQRLVQYLRDHERHVRLCDQDAMNAVFNNQWGQLDLRWNVLSYMEGANCSSLLDKKSLEALMLRACLLHFCGPDKPWKAHCEHVRRDRFFHYLDLTAWAGWRPSLRPTIKSVLLHLLRKVRVTLRSIMNAT